VNEKSAVQNCPKNRLGDNLKMFFFPENLKDCWVLFSNTERQSGLVFFVIFPFFCNIDNNKELCLKIVFFEGGVIMKGGTAF